MSDAHSSTTDGRSLAETYNSTLVAFTLINRHTDRQTDTSTDNKTHLQMIGKCLYRK